MPSEVPTGKGKRLIILNVGYEGGFLPKCSLVFVGKSTSIDYHGEMNDDHFEELFELKLRKILPAGTAIVMDNVPYHTVKTKESWAPTLKTRKADI